MPLDTGGADHERRRVGLIDLDCLVAAADQPQRQAARLVCAKIAGGALRAGNAARIARLTEIRRPIDSWTACQDGNGIDGAAIIARRA